VFSPEWDPPYSNYARRNVPTPRPSVLGKAVYCGETKLWVKGVTYGTFRPDEYGSEFHDPRLVESDFRAISSNGFNCIRTYTVPPLWVLGLASKCGLHVMVGLPWEQHVTFLDSKERQRKIRNEIRTRIRNCSGHPAILCYALGSEIPAPIARWYGARRIERFLRELWTDAKSQDPQGLFTYVNYPSTEYLNIDFADLFCFNVYLENREHLSNYVAHLHNIAGDRPLILTELGLDSLRHGEQKQAEVLHWQVQTAFAEGCGGAFLFSWTDEWHRGGHDISDWAFGLTTSRRRPKPALSVVSRALKEIPFESRSAWPRITVVVCTFNGERTIKECLDGLQQLDYPDYEVIIVDDGSTDSTGEIAREYPFRLITTDNRGLSSARNTGFNAATGEIVAYIDDDAYPTSEWLKYLATTFLTTDHAAVGGPNLSPPTDGFIADCIAHAPGGPIHVLLSDREAEHIPGCNMAIRKSCLEAIGGFDAIFRVAGDDVDVCWRLQQYGWSLGFNASAVVWHHRRNSIRTYWKQQRGYGKAEALLEAKWPEKYNFSGHPAWAGRIYSPGFSQSLRRVKRIFHGVWGGALFQSVYQPAPTLLSSISLMPEWYLLIGILGLLSGIGVLWAPLLAAFPLLLGAAGLTVVQAIVRSMDARHVRKDRSRVVRFFSLSTIAFLHGLQPLARLFGRLRHGLSPWRRRGVRGWRWPWPRRTNIWSEHWRSTEDWLKAVETDLRKAGTRVIRGGDYDRWDLDISDGTFCSVRLMSVIEEHGEGKQLVRFQLTPRCSPWTLVMIVLTALLSIFAVADGAWLAFLILAVFPLNFTMRILGDSGLAMATIMRALQNVEKDTNELKKSMQNQNGESETAVAANVLSVISFTQADKYLPE
jgi:glycosyltransferase involved in cell wall biosynthesis